VTWIQSCGAQLATIAQFFHIRNTAMSTVLSVCYAVTYLKVIRPNYSSSIPNRAAVPGQILYRVQKAQATRRHDQN